MTVAQVFFSLDENKQCQAVTFCDSMVTLNDVISLSVVYCSKDGARQLASHICAFWRHSEKSVKQFKRCFLIVCVSKSVGVDAVADTVTSLFDTQPSRLEDWRLVIAETKEKLQPIVSLEYNPN